MKDWGIIVGQEQKKIFSKTFFHRFFPSAKNSRFITSAGGGRVQE
jgi:hypothetical protein